MENPLTREYRQLTREYPQLNPIEQRDKARFEAALKEGDIQIVMEYSKRYANITFEKGYKSIHYVCEIGNIDIVQLLIDFCDENCETAMIERPIHLAVKNGHFTVVRKLIEHKCDIECEEKQKLRPIHFACMNGHVDVIRLLIEQHCDIECETEQKWRPIHFACLNGHIDVIRLLIEQHCDIECETKQRWRPIHFACLNGHIEIVRLLINRKCDIECETKQCITPIKLACVNGHNDIVDLLLEVSREGKSEDQRGAIADKMGLTCGPSCDHKGFCRESLITNPSDIPGNEIGEGAFGAVYRLRESATCRQFAMKRIKYDPEEGKLKNIENYINICLEDLKHENIVKYYGSITEIVSKDVYIFMEYVEGGSLYNYIVKNKRITHDKVIMFTKQILEGVSFLHLHRIVHRNIKPANILLDEKEKPKLAGFGLSRFLQCSHSFHRESPKLFIPFLKEYRKESVSSMLVDFLDSDSKIFSFATMNNDTEAITIHPCCEGVGTMGYVAPEIRKNKPYGLAVDIWSVGATMFHMLKGKPPSPYKRVIKIDKPGFVYELMNKMGNEDPSDRPTAILLLEEIKEKERASFSYFISNVEK